MSRFTEYFDIDTNQLMYSQDISSPSKASILTMSSSESIAGPRKYHQINPIITQSYSSFESNESSDLKCQTVPPSPTSSFEEKSSSAQKLKRFLTTISNKKKQRSMSSDSQ